ncbi:MAG: methyltransferase [Bacilli bacterium]|nr:methyltransferase [Bacilli bacterium]
MKIVLTKQEEKLCNKFLEVKENNISAAEFYIDYLTNYYDEISKFDIDILSQKYDLNKSFFKAMLKKMRVKENDSEFIQINENSNIADTRLLDINDYINDEFVKAVGQVNAETKEWMLTKLHYNSYEGFVYDELEIDNEFYKEKTPLGFFKDDFSYLAVIQNDSIWMSVIPHEINTMKEPIKHAYGNVLVLGLGLGYYAFHVSNKEDVTKVTVVEKDEKVIKLFKENILPKFPNKKKIEIIHDDAYHFLETMNEYDYIFSDIWHNVGDGLELYLKIKPYELVYKYTRFDYWIEKSLLAMLRRELLTIFEEIHFGGYTDENYKIAYNKTDETINALYFLTKDIEINTSDDLRKLLSDESLSKIARYIIKR